MITQFAVDHSSIFYYALLFTMALKYQKNIWDCHGWLSNSESVKIKKNKSSHIFVVVYIFNKNASWRSKVGLILDHVNAQGVSRQHFIIFFLFSFPYLILCYMTLFQYYQFVHWGRLWWFRLTNLLQSNKQTQSACEKYSIHWDHGLSFHCRKPSVKWDAFMKQKAKKKVQLASPIKAKQKRAFCFRRFMRNSISTEQWETSNKCK